MVVAYCKTHNLNVTLRHIVALLYIKIVDRHLIILAGYSKAVDRDFYCKNEECSL